MKTRVTIETLRPGMRIHSMDRSWLLTPFLTHRFTITSLEQIEQLRACGVTTLDVTMDELETAHNEPAELTPDLQTPEETALTEVPTVTVPFEEELPIAREVYRDAKVIIQDAMSDVRMGRAIDMDTVNQVIDHMTDSIFRNPDALTSLSRLKSHDEYTFYHSVNTALLAMALGRAAGCDRTQLHQLGVGTLLHDIGKSKIPLEILNKPGRFEADEFELMKQHVMRGVEILSDLTHLSDPFLKPALEHHERVDGSGYPLRRDRTMLSQFGLISAIVDIYDAITSERCYHKPQSAHDAMAYVYRISQEGHLDHTLVQRFIQVVGVYPVGTLLALNTGETAIVSALHHDALLKPVVLVVTTPGNTPLHAPIPVDLQRQAPSSTRTIRQVLHPHESQIDPQHYLDSVA